MIHRINIVDGNPKSEVVRLRIGGCSFWNDRDELILTRDHVQQRLAGVIRRLARTFDCSRENPERDALLRAKAVYEDLLE